jgi:SP family sugar:H+ symporter-like MFS transporter
MFLVGIIPASIYGLLALRIPESPYYLVATGRLEEAQAVFARIIGGDAASKVESIRETLTTEHRPSVRDLRGDSFGLLPIVWIGIILSVLQQFVGINVIFYYSSVLWQAVGFTEDDSLKISVFTSVVNIVTTLVAISLIDRVGRRPLLLLGSSGMVLTLGTLAVLFGTAPLVQVAATPTCGAPCMQPSLTGAAGTVALVAANFYVFFFGMSWGPAIWVLLGEMFPNSIRAAALAVAAAAQWLANWVVSTSFPTLSSWSLGIAYGIYTFFAAVSIWFVARKVTETRGKELGHIS